MNYNATKPSMRSEYVRTKDAMMLFSMSGDKIVELAKECGAYHKVHNIVLIHRQTMIDYIDTFRA